MLVMWMRGKVLQVMLSNAAISWSSKKQPVVSLSTTEAEFISVAACACQAVCLRRILKEIRPFTVEGNHNDV